MLTKISLSLWIIVKFYSLYLVLRHIVARVHVFMRSVTAVFLHVTDEIGKTNVDGNNFYKFALTFSCDDLNFLNSFNPDFTVCLFL